jgi:hypothetical protein
MPRKNAADSVSHLGRGRPAGANENEDSSDLKVLGMTKSSAVLKEVKNCRNAPGSG